MLHSLDQCFFLYTPLIFFAYLLSHHPYIINNIPWDTWQIVSKSGNKVRVRKSLNIPELNTASSLDKFTQLVNLLDGEEVSE